jgi:8-oxo-dGTP pyrophosphatase MutT (NUDIX family)
MLAIFIIGLLNLFNCEAAPPGAGVILIRNHEVLLVKNVLTGSWGFTKGTYEPSDTSYLANAIREVTEESGYYEGLDYTIYGGPCKFGKRPYWFGSVHTTTPVRMNHTDHVDIRWHRIHSKIYNPNKDLEAWMDDGRPTTCPKN